MQDGVNDDEKNIYGELNKYNKTHAYTQTKTHHRLNINKHLIRY